jgi:hypothetical protein
MEILSGVKVVVVLVRCAWSLLACEEISTNHLRFGDIEDCWSRLPSLIAQEQRNHGRPSLVMGRCHFILEHAPKGLWASWQHQPATGSAHSNFRWIKDNDERVQ